MGVGDNLTGVSVRKWSESTTVFFLSFWTWCIAVVQSLSAASLMCLLFDSCRSFAVPFHAPDVLREAAHGPLQHSWRQMDREFLNLIRYIIIYGWFLQPFLILFLWLWCFRCQVAFFRQFFGSVTKVDYLTMRQGFINVINSLTHLEPLFTVAATERSFWSYYTQIWH